MRKQGFSLLTCSILEKQEALTIHKKKCQSLNNYNFILNLMTLKRQSTTSPLVINGVPFFIFVIYWRQILAGRTRL